MPSNLTILITTNYYWPEDAGSAPYLTGLAEHLAERGHEVLVATTFQHYPEWRSAAPGRFGASETHRGVAIRRRWNYVPRSQSALQRAGYEFSLLTLGLTALPWRRRPDVVLGTSPSLAGSILAATAARRHGVPYGLVFQDLMGLAAAQSGVAGGARAPRGGPRPGGGGGGGGGVGGGTWRRAGGGGGGGGAGGAPRLSSGGGGAAPVGRARPQMGPRRTEPSASREEMRQRFGWSDRDF